MRTVHECADRVAHDLRSRVQKSVKMDCVEDRPDALSKRKELVERAEERARRSMFADVVEVHP